MRWLYQLYKLTWFAGAILALPFVLLVAWYGWSVYADVDRYRRALKSREPLSAELFQIFLHDELVRDLHRFTLPSRPSTSVLPTLELSLTRAKLDELRSQLSKPGAGVYVDATLKKDDEVYKVGVRYRGGQPWHRLGAQKSMKVHLESGALLDGVRVFNLLNDVTPFGLEDQIILDLAREAGLLAPEYEPVWVRINNSDMGVYRYEAQPEEGLLRRGRRYPASIFSGDTDVVRKDRVAGALFWEQSGWTKVAWKDEAHRNDAGEIERFLQAVGASTHREFARYVNENVNLERYAAFDALDVVFGGAEHDYLTNHKLYFDPYVGKLEPVAWSFRGFQHEPMLNLVDNPLLIRLKLTPGYLAIRNRLVYELLTGKASVPEVRARAARAFRRVAPDLSADPYWDAYKLLPRVSRFYRFMSRPMSKAKWALAAEAEIETFANRSRYLLNLLEARTVSAASAWVGGNVAALVLTVDGQVGYAFNELTLHAPCRSPFVVHADSDRDGRYDPTRDTLVASGKVGVGTAPFHYVDLAPGLTLVARSDNQPKRGDVRTEATPEHYRYFVAVRDCRPTSADLDLGNTVTRGSTRVHVDLVAPRAAVEERTAPAAVADLAPALAAGEKAPHPWEYPPRPANTVVRLGPGVVRLETGRVFATHEAVLLEAGTRLLLGPGASLVFLGPVTADGSVLEPVVIGRLDPAQPFGGVALQGQQTAGSRLVYVRVEGGSRASYADVDYDAVLGIHDTHDVTLRDFVIAGDGATDDVVHAAYVTALTLHELEVSGGPQDGIDLEFVSGDLRGLRVANSGDDCLDLMGVQLRLADSVLLGCSNNGISAGEESAVAANGVVVAGAKVGVLAKNHSEVRLNRSLVYQASEALRTNRREMHYAGGSSIGASDLAAVGCGVVANAAKNTTIDVGYVQTDLVESGSLNHILEQVLRLSAWAEFEAQVPPRVSLDGGEAP
ncbi:MAG: CotH kinase family protein [Deltaproteobacteria bacterium]|nr:CotH kinase family protein [Deltaproteobacteria bacterium]